MWTKLVRSVSKGRCLDVLQYEKQTLLINSLSYVSGMREGLYFGFQV